jgi:hypothetical protein
MISDPATARSSAKALISTERNKIAEDPSITARDRWTPARNSGLMGSVSE